MSTPAQIAANRENCKASTGPTSEIGRQTVSQNALKNGLSSKVHFALPGERDALEEHVAGYMEAYAPVGLPERDLVRNIASNHFRLQRAHRLEHSLFMQIEMLEQSAAAGSAADDAEEIWTGKKTELKNVSLQAGRIQRAIEKSTAELKSMQANRNAAYDKTQEEAILLTQLAHAKGEKLDPAKDFPPPARCGGFVYSLAEILRVLDREARLEEAKARFLVAA
jgi:hypothetical protein